MILAISIGLSDPVNDVCAELLYCFCTLHNQKSISFELEHESHADNGMFHLLDYNAALPSGNILISVMPTCDGIEILDLL